MLTSQTIGLIVHIPKHIIVAFSAWGGRLVTVFVQFYSIKILLDLLGTDGYAVFTVMASLLGWFMLADFGIGYSLQNRISDRRVKNQEYQDLIFIATVAVVPLLILFLLLIYFTTPLLSEFLLSDFSFLNDELRIEILQLTSLIFLTTSIGNISFKIWFAEHKGWIPNIIPALSSILGLILLFGITSTDSNLARIIIVTIKYFYLPAAVIAIFSFLLKMIPSLKYYNLFTKENFYLLLINGGGFFIFSFLSALVLQVDYIIMSKTLIGKDVVIYNIMSKIFGLVNFIYAALLQSLWPVCAEASSRGRISDLLKIAKRYIFFGFMIVLFSAIFVFLLKDLILKLLAANQGLEFSLILIVLFSIYHLLRIWTDTYAMFLLSAGKLKPLWISVPFQAFLSIILQWYGAVNYGLAGLIGGLILSFLLTVVWWLPLCFIRLVKNNKIGSI
ncbi:MULTISPECIES: MATE family efflux transporter [Yersinia]|uniref:MATE family efflux transporter n=1 Tax=Yersinia TaxID=629 RepID=UPI00031834AE|nr:MULTISPECIES: MATE family efflux transporter [Yersinia]MCB5307764.1 MATE family efflux transporter [Yersinia massiliensis]